jgi:hypothetical protein
LNYTDSSELLFLFFWDASLIVTGLLAGLELFGSSASSNVRATVNLRSAPFCSFYFRAAHCRMDVAKNTDPNFFSKENNSPIFYIFQLLSLALESSSQSFRFLFFFFVSSAYFFQ